MEKWRIYTEWVENLPDRFDPELAAAYPDYALHHKVFHATSEEMKDLIARYSEAELPSGHDVMAANDRDLYDVRRHGNHLVEGWAQERLPFASNRWEGFRNDLGAAIRELSARPGEGLHATYTNSQTDRVDIENALIYNVGTGAFRRSTREGLTFERSFSEPVSSQAHLSHYYRYEVVPLSQRVLEWDRGQPLAEWTCHLPSLDPETKPAAVWWATKHGEAAIHADAPHGGWFGIRLEIQMPETRRSLAEIVKPLADGSIAAFQSHAKGSDVPALADRVARSLDAPAPDVAEALCDESWAVISGHRILWKRGAGVQWNPADERCVGAILRKVGAMSKRGVVKGELFELVPPTDPTSRQAAH